MQKGSRWTASHIVAFIKLYIDEYNIAKNKKRTINSHWFEKLAEKTRAKFQDKNLKKVTTNGYTIKNKYNSLVKDYEVRA